MTRMQRWLGVVGMATVIVIAVTVVPGLLGHPIPDLTRNMLLGALFIIGTWRIFWPTPWLPTLSGAAAMVVLTYIASLPAMNTTTANVISWVAILLGALGAGLYQKRRAHRRT